MVQLQLVRNGSNGERPINVTLIVIGLFLTLLIALVPAVVGYGSLLEKVNEIENNNDDIENRVLVLEKIAAGVEVSLYNMASDISEIKDDIDEIRNDLKGRE